MKVPNSESTRIALPQTAILQTRLDCCLEKLGKCSSPAVLLFSVWPKQIPKRKGREAGTERGKKSNKRMWQKRTMFTKKERWPDCHRWHSLDIKLIPGLLTHTVFYRIPGTDVVLRTVGDPDYHKNVGTWVIARWGKNILTTTFWCDNRGVVLFRSRAPCIAWENTASIWGKVFVSGKVQVQGQVLTKPLESICCSVKLYPVTIEVRCVCG